MSAPAPFTPEQLRAAIDSLPENMRAIFAAVAPEMEIDTDQRPGVVVWIADSRLHVATPWKPSKLHFGDRMNPSSYCGIVTTGTKARWVDAIFAGPNRSTGAWTMVADAVAAGVVELLRKAGYSVSKAASTAAALDALAFMRARAPMRLAKRRRKAEAADVGPAGASSHASLDLSAIPDAEVAADPRA